MNGIVTSGMSGRPEQVVCETCHQQVLVSQAIVYRVVEPIDGDARILRATGQTAYYCRPCEYGYFAALERGECA